MKAGNFASNEILRNTSGISGEGLSTQQEETRSLPDYPEHVRNQPRLLAN